MLFDAYTAKNHKELVRDAIAKANRALAELDKHEANLRLPNGLPRFSPQGEQEQRLLIDARRQEVLAERDQIITNAREVAEAGAKARQAHIDRIARLQQSPIRRLHATEAANVRALVDLLEAGFSRSSFSDMIGEVSAAMLDSNRDQQIAICEVLQRRMTALQAATPAGQKIDGVALSQYNELDEAATALVRKLQDPTLAHEHKDHAAGLKAAEELLADVRAQDHPIRVAEAQEKLVATGLYGDRVVERPVLHNMNEAPVHEMVEQA